MLYRSRWMLLALIIAALSLAGCSDKDGYVKIESAHTEHEAGEEFTLVTFTEKAVERIGVETGEVREIPVSRSHGDKRKVVPYASLLYDPYGKTWVYISPKPFNYVRRPVEVDYIEGDLVVLLDGPPVGTVVVTTGTAEVYGTEFKVGH
jgi:hypothetical protein